MGSSAAAWQDDAVMMRGQVSAAVCALVLPTCLGGCAREEGQINLENLLELSLGGNYESLATRLRRPPPGTTQRISPPPRPEITELDQTLEPPVAPPERDRTPTTPPPAEPPPKTPSEFHVVTLTEGQTLYGVCRTELGSGGRWKEVAALNGWSETQAARLNVGQKVMLPVR